jgi:hypothetical protein
VSALQVAVFGVSVALIATKFFDCWSTADRMREPSYETNPLARRAMTRFGPQVTIWGIFALVVLIVAVVGENAYRAAPELSTAPAAQAVKHIGVWGYIVLGLFISAVQAAVAQTNRTGRFNVLSRAVLNVTGWFMR